MDARLSRLRTISIVVGALFLVAVVSLWPAIKGHVQAAMMIDALSSRKTTKLQRLISSPASSVPITIPSAIEPIEGHLYGRTRAKRGTGIILIHGFSPVGDNYYQLIDASMSLARSGFSVLTPTIPHLTKYMVDEQSVRMIGESSLWLAKETGAPVTLIGVSFSGALALVAASRPEYRDSIRQVIVLSTYDDLQRIIQFYLTGVEPMPDGTTSVIEYDRGFMVSIAALQFLGDLVPAEDVDRVRDAVQQTLVQRVSNAPLNPSILEALTPREREEAEDILAPTAALKQNILKATYAWEAGERQLSPHWQVQSIKASVTIIGGTEDPAIPTGEQFWIAHDLPPGKIRRILISPVLQHVVILGTRQIDLYHRAKRIMQILLLIHALAPAMEAASA